MTVERKCDFQKSQVHSYIIFMGKDTGGQTIGVSRDPTGGSVLTQRTGQLSFVGQVPAANRSYASSPAKNKSNASFLTIALFFKIFLNIYNILF